MLITTQISVIISLIKNMLGNKTLMIDRKTPAGKCESMEQPPSKRKPRTRRTWPVSHGLNTAHTPEVAKGSVQSQRSGSAESARWGDPRNPRIKWLSYKIKETHKWHSTSDNAKCYQENKAGKRGGCAGGGGEVSVSNTVLRKASLGWNISAGPEKSDTKSQRRSERTLCVWTQQWPSEERHSLGRL